jgi:hypothetical protein
MQTIGKEEARLYLKDKNKEMDVPFWTTVYVLSSLNVGLIIALLWCLYE